MKLTLIIEEYIVRTYKVLYNEKDSIIRIMDIVSTQQSPKKLKRK